MRQAGAICRSTAPRARRPAVSWTCAPSRTWPARSPCSRCAASPSTPLILFSDILTVPDAMGLACPSPRAKARASPPAAQRGGHRAAGRARPGRPAALRDGRRNDPPVSLDGSAPDRFSPAAPDTGLYDRGRLVQFRPRQGPWPGTTRPCCTACWTRWHGRWRPIWRPRQRPAQALMVFDTWAACCRPPCNGRVLVALSGVGRRRCPGGDAHARARC